MQGPNSAMEYGQDAQAILRAVSCGHVEASRKTQRCQVGNGNLQRRENTSCCHMEITSVGKIMCEL